MMKIIDNANAYSITSSLGICLRRASQLQYDFELAPHDADVLLNDIMQC